MNFSLLNLPFSLDNCIRVFVKAGQWRFMKVARVLSPVYTLGPGKRLVLWTAGCPRRCRGCISPEYQTAERYEEIPVTTLFQGIRQLFLQTGCDSITISGGEPFLQSGDLANLLNAVRSDRALSVRDILLYTGYTAEELQVDDKDSAVSRVLNLADVLIDGPYIEGQNDGKSPLWGSSNQRILFLHSNTDIEERFRKYLKEKSREAQNFYSGGQIVTVGIPQPGME